MVEFFGICLAKMSLVEITITGPGKNENKQNDPKIYGYIVGKKACIFLLDLRS